MVEIAADVALVALDVRFQERGIAGQGLVAIAHTVRLDVRFGHHIDAVFVAELIPVRVVGIMAGTHGVHVELLHQPDILFHPLVRYHIAAVGIEFVPVHALDENALAVDQQVGALDLHLAETDREMQGLQGILPVLERNVELVEIRIFRAPLVRVLHVEAAAHESARGLDGIGRLLPLRIDEAHFNARAARVGNREVDGQRAVAVVHVEVGRDLHVLDVLDGARIHIAVAGDARETEEILVFEIGAVAPAEHLERDEVALARFQELRHIELALELAVFAVSHELPVHPQIDAGRHGAKVQDDLLAFPLGRNGEILPVRTDVVVVGRRDGRLALIAAGPRIADIHVNGIAVAVQFPHGRDGHPAPERGHIVGAPEPFGPLVGAADPEEIPVARQGDAAGLVGQEGAVHGKTVDGVHVGILPFGESLRKAGQRQGRKQQGEQ